MLEFLICYFGDRTLESLKGKRCCKQVKFYPGVCALAARRFCLSRILARPLTPAALRSAQSSRRIPLAGLRRGLARIASKRTNPDRAGVRPMSVNLSDAELAEASNCRRTVSVCTPSKRCKAGTLRLLPLKLTPIGSRPYRLQIAEKPWLVCLGGGGEPLAAP